jgi:hypothetical protein
MMTIAPFRTSGRSSAVWRGLWGVTDSTRRRWQDKRPRGAAMGGCGFSNGYRERLHITPNGRSLQARPFSSDLNCLARCAALRHERQKRVPHPPGVASGHHPLSGRDRSSRRHWLRCRRRAALFRARGGSAPAIVRILSTESAPAYRPTGSSRRARAAPSSRHA